MSHWLEECYRLLTNRHLDLVQDKGRHPYLLRESSGRESSKQSLPRLQVTSGTDNFLWLKEKPQLGNTRTLQL